MYWSALLYRRRRASNNSMSCQCRRESGFGLGADAESCGGRLQISGCRNRAGLVASDRPRVLGLGCERIAARRVFRGRGLNTRLARFRARPRYCVSLTKDGYTVPNTCARGIFFAVRPHPCPLPEGRGYDGDYFALALPVPVEAVEGSGTCLAPRT